MTTNPPAPDVACEVPMSEHIARFWRLLEEDRVRILVDTYCADSFGGIGHWNGSSFPNDVAKALLSERCPPAPSAQQMLDALQRIALLDEADGHELTVDHAFRAVGIASQTLGKHPSEIATAIQRPTQSTREQLDDPVFISGYFHDRFKAGERPPGFIGPKGEAPGAEAVALRNVVLAADRLCEEILEGGWTAPNTQLSDVREALLILEKQDKTRLQNALRHA